MAVPTACPNVFQLPQGEQKQKQRRLPLLRTRITERCPGLSQAMREALPCRNLLAGLVDHQSLGRMVVSFRKRYLIAKNESD